MIFKATLKKCQSGKNAFFPRIFPPVTRGALPGKEIKYKAEKRTSFY